MSTDFPFRPPAAETVLSPPRRGVENRAASPNQPASRFGQMSALPFQPSLQQLPKLAGASTAPTYLKNASLYSSNTPSLTQQETTESPQAEQADSNKATATTKGEKRLPWYAKLFPAIALTTAPAIIGSQMLGVYHKAVETNGWKALFPSKASDVLFSPSKLYNALPIKPSPKLLTGINKAGNKFLGLSVIIKSLIMLRFGLNAEQPSFVLGSLVNLLAVPFTMTGSLIGTLMDYFSGGLYMTGVANYVENQQLNKKGLPARRAYNPYERVRKAFNRQADFGGLGKRLSYGLSAFSPKALAEQASFIKDDFIAELGTFKRVVNNLRHGRPIQENSYLNQHKSALSTASLNDKAVKEEAKDEATPDLSRVGVLFIYMATLPTLFSKILPASPIKKLMQAGSLTSGILGSLILDASMLMVTLRSSDRLDQIAGVGTAMEMTGNLSSVMPDTKGRGLTWLIKQYVNPVKFAGASVSNLFYASNADEQVIDKEDLQQATTAQPAGLTPAVPSPQPPASPEFTAPLPQTTSEPPISLNPAATSALQPVTLTPKASPFSAGPIDPLKQPLAVMPMPPAGSRPLDGPRQTPAAFPVTA